MKQFIKEGWIRLGQEGPPWIVKMQLLMGAVTTFSGTLAVIPWSGSFTIIHSVGIGLGLFSAGMIAAGQFAVKTIGILIPAGGAITNESSTDIEVKPAGVSAKVSNNINTGRLNTTTTGLNTAELNTTILSTTTTNSNLTTYSVAVDPNYIRNYKLNQKP